MRRGDRALYTYLLNRTLPSYQLLTVADILVSAPEERVTLERLQLPPGLSHIHRRKATQESNVCFVAGARAECDVDIPHHPAAGQTGSAKWK